MSIEKIQYDDSSASSSCNHMSLREFLDCFPPPQKGEIAEGGGADFDVHAAFDIPKGTTLTFCRKVSPSVTVSYPDPRGGASSEAGSMTRVTLPVDSPGNFRLLPYDPASGDCSPDHIYPTVEDLVKAFPARVQANAAYGDPLTDPTTAFRIGDRMSLLRMVYKESIRYLECRQFSDPQILLLPMVCQGDFTVLPDSATYTLEAITNMAPRRRHVERVRDKTGMVAHIPGLSDDYEGQLFVEEPESFVEACPAHDPSVIIGLPLDLNLDICPDDSVYDRGQLLASFAHNNRHILPVAARVTDWEQQTAILENQRIQPGSEVVIHGWTRQSKVLASAEDRHWSIPLTYQGRFQIHPKQYHGVSQLLKVHPGTTLKVLRGDTDANFPLHESDVIRLRQQDTKKQHFREVEIKCDRVGDQGKNSCVKLPLGSDAVFQEILGDNEEYVVKDLLPFLADGSVTVSLCKNSPDYRDPSQDLPMDIPIHLRSFTMEPGVYVSVHGVDNPAFHIPLRTLIYVSFIAQYERTASPLLSRNSPRLSTLDRCVETVSRDTFNALQSQLMLDSGDQGAGEETDSLPEKIAPISEDRYTRSVIQTGLGYPRKYMYLN